jgi:hypothetical protein
MAGYDSYDCFASYSIAAANDNHVRPVSCNSPQITLAPFVLERQELKRGEILICNPTLLVVNVEGNTGY